MAITSIGYGGTANAIDEIAWAKIWAFQGGGTPVVKGANDFKVTINTTADRTVDVAPGDSWGAGVLVSSDAITSLQLDAVGSGYRVDAIVLRRSGAGDGGNSTIQVIKNGSTNTNAVPTGVQRNPGVTFDQLLGLVRIDFNKPRPAWVADMRVWGSQHYLTTDLRAAEPAPSIGTTMYVSDDEEDSTIRYIRRATEWEADQTPLSGVVAKKLTGSNVATAKPGWEILKATGCLIGNFTTFYLELRRTSTTAIVSDGGSGNFADAVVATVKTPFKPNWNQPFNATYWGAESTKDTVFAGLGCHCTLYTDGDITIFSGAPGQDIRKRAKTTELSFRCSVTFFNQV